MLQHVSSPALGSSTVAWNVFFMTTCTGSPFLNEFSSSSVWQFVGVYNAELPGTWWTTVHPLLTSSVVSIYVPPVVVSSWCPVTLSARSAVGPSLLMVRCPGTHYRTVSASRRVMTTFQATVSNIHWKHFSLVDIDVPSAVKVFTTLRYINLYLLTYLLTKTQHMATQWMVWNFQTYFSLLTKVVRIEYIDLLIVYLIHAADNIETETLQKTRRKAGV